MAAIWTPDNSLPLIDTQEDATNVVASVTVAADPLAVPPDTVTGLSWSASPPLPPQADVSVDGATLTVALPDFVGVFPIQEIRYLLGGVPGVCFAWEDLPAAAEDVIAYRPDPGNLKETVLTITAQFQTGEPEAKDYLIRVIANYSLGRDALTEAVDARR